MNRLKKRNTVLIAAALIVMAAAILILARLNAPRGEVLSGSISIVQNGEILHTYTSEEILSLPYVEVDKEIVSSSHKNERGIFRGVPLRALLDNVGDTLLGSATRIVARAEDAFVTSYSAEEVAESDNIFVAYSRDGQGLGTLEDGGTGPFRIVIRDDEFGTRSTKYLFELEVQ